MYEAPWSPSYDPMWSLTLARLGRAGGAEKYSSPAGKPFFDTIDPFRKSPVTPPRHGAHSDHLARLLGFLGHAQRIFSTSNLPACIRKPSRLAPSVRYLI